MEFGMVGLDGLLSSSNDIASLTSDQAARQSWCGSAGFLKDNHNGGLRASKIAKLGVDLSASKPSSFVFSDVGHQEHNMLSFSSPKLEAFSTKNNGGLESKSLQSSSFPNFFRYQSASCCKSSGYSCSGGGVNASMYFLNGLKGPFTPAQLLELEQQAMIYKYIVANEPIPPNLLIPITRAVESAGFCGYPGELLRPNSFGWGSFHLGFSNSTDPEPGRCRRTDGKKWRCSRDAVPDQKYCERHMNRGRHRSRKPVEGHPGHSVTGATVNKTTSTPNLPNVASSSSTLVVPGGCPTSSLAITLNQNEDLQPVTRLDFLSPTMSLNSSGNSLSIDKGQIPYAESGAGFRGLRSQVFINSKQKGSSYRTNYGSSFDRNAEEYDPRHSDQSSILWPELRSQSDYRTQLSISIPVVPADFMSSTSSPTGERVTTLSPLRLSHALDSVEMGLGVGIMDQCNKQTNWVPISWETSMGGPLGEVLKTTSNSSEDHNKHEASDLNLLSKGWEDSPKLASSPKDVLQSTGLGSVSTSSAGSSPRTENGKALECGSRCVNLVGFAKGNSSALPTL